LTSGDGSHGRGAGTGAGRLSFAHAPLKQANFNLVFISEGYKLDIDPLGEMAVLADFGGFSLPSMSKIGDENYEVWIAHRYRETRDQARSELDGKLVSDLRFPHVGLEFERHLVSCQKGAGLEAGTGSDHDFFSGLLGTEVGGDAAGTVAGNFSLGAIGVEQASANIRVGDWEQPLHAVGTDAVVAVANLPGEGGNFARGMAGIDDQEIVTAGRSLDEWDSGAHSCSAELMEVTLEKTPD
jgi:hypothetical protein